jgi:hypothetical protein
MRWKDALSSIWLSYLSGIGPVALGVEGLVKAVESARNLAKAVSPLSEPRITGRDKVLETFRRW